MQYITFGISSGFRNTNVSNRKNESQTFIDNRYFMPVVHQSWQLAKTVLFGQLLVVDLHETDSELVSFVVDVLQLLKGLRALFALWLV